MQTTSLASVQHPMPRLYRPLAHEHSSQSTSRVAALARKHLPGAFFYPFESHESIQSVVLPAPFDSPCRHDSTILICSCELVANASIMARDQISESKLVHVNRPGKIPCSEFDAIVTARYEVANSDEEMTNVVSSPLSLHDVTSQRLNSHAEQQPCDDIIALQSPRLALFLGEPGVACQEFWSDAGAARLSQQLASIAGSDGSVVIIASSCTPDTFALRLQRLLASKLGLNRVIYEDGSSRARHLFLLATSDGIVITGDCLVTVSEAVTAVSAPIALVGVGSSPESERLANSLAFAGRVSHLNDANCAAFRASMDSRRTASELNVSMAGDGDIDGVAAAVWATILP